MSSLSESDKALAIALVRAHMINDKESVSYVPSYIRVSWATSLNKCVAVHIGEHYRRRANSKRTIDALACVCKQPELAAPTGDDPLLGRKRKR